MIALKRASFGSKTEASNNLGSEFLMKADTFSPPIPWPSATA